MTDGSSSPDLTVLIVTAVATLLTSVAKGIIDFYRERAARQDRAHVAEKIETVATAATVSAEGVAHVAQDLAITKAEKAAKNAVLDAKLDTIGATAAATHTLVNGKMAAQLAKTASFARKLADLTQEPAHVIDAVAAEKALADHLAAEKAAR